MRFLDRGTSTPLHAQLTTILRGKIERGDWQPGEKIASENELSISTASAERRPARY